MRWICWDGALSMEKKLIFSFVILSLFFNLAYTQKMYNKNKSKLDEIMKKLDEKNKELEDYTIRYEKILKEIKKIKTNEKNVSEKINNLNLSLQRLKSEIENTKNKQSILKKTYDNMVKEISQDISSLYLSRFSSSYFYGTNQIISQMIKRNIIILSSDFARSIDYKAKFFSKNIDKLSKNKTKFNAEIIKANKLLSENKKGIKEKEKELVLTDSKLKKLKNEIDELNRTANQLSTFIRDIEKKSPYKLERKKEIDIKKNSLPWPIIGKIVKKFGKEYVESLKTWIVNDGIKIKPQTRVSVRPVMAGRVVFSGAFKGFGNIVVIEHENNIYTTYGFLSNITVLSGMNVDENTVIGNTGTDTRDLENKEEDVLYFEIRNGEEPLNPIEYLK